MPIEKTLTEIERFFERAGTVSGIEGFPETLEPATDAQIDKFAKKFQLTIPPEVRKFWKRGLKFRQLSLEDEKGEYLASAGFDWYSLRLLERDIPMYRDVAKLYEPDTHERRLLEQGVPLSYSEPRIVWDPRGGIVHFSTRNNLLPPLTKSFAEFLEHWLEAGCFSSHQVTKYLPKVKHLVPGRIPPGKNLWIKYYKKVFGKDA